MLDEIDNASDVESIDKSVKTAIETTNSYFYSEK